MASSITTANMPIGSPLNHISLADNPLFHVPVPLEFTGTQTIEDKARTLFWKGSPKGVQQHEGSGVFREYENYTIWATKFADGTWYAAKIHGSILLHHRSIGGGKAVTGYLVTNEAWASDHRDHFN